MSGVGATPLSSAVPLGVDQQVSLQADLQTPHSFAPWRVGDQRQLVEHSSTKVISHHRETVIGAPQLKYDWRRFQRTDGRTDRRIEECEISWLPVY